MTTQRCDEYEDNILAGWSFDIDEYLSDCIQHYELRVVSSGDFMGPGPLLAALLALVHSGFHPQLYGHRGILTNRVSLLLSNQYFNIYYNLSADEFA